MPSELPTAMPRRWPAARLKTRLLLTFCALATGPALIVMVLQFNAGERSLKQAVQAVQARGEASVHESSQQSTASALATITQTSAQLIGLSERAVSQTSESLMAISQERLQASSGKIIDLSRKSHHQLTEGLVDFSGRASQQLSHELIDQSTASHRQLSQTTSRLAERALAENTERLLRLNQRLADSLGTYLTAANQHAADDASRQLLEELHADPRVDFRSLAQLLAKSMAGGPVSDSQEAYVIQVNRRGEVLASTRYKRGTPLRDLPIVKRALKDPAEVAAQMPLIAYQDGEVPYMGVYARRRDGGAVIVSYGVKHAEADFEGLKTLVSGSLQSLAAVTSAGARLAIAESTPQIKKEALTLADSTIRTIKAASAEAADQAAGRMASRANLLAERDGRAMNEKAVKLSTESASLMQREARAVLRQASEEMAPIGRRHAERAVAAMTPEARRAVATIQAQLEPRIEGLSQAAASKMLPEAEAALSSSREQTVGIAVGLLLGSMLLGVLVSLWLSRRIANPIEVEKQRQQTELARMGKEMEIARRIQESLVPSNMAADDFDLSLSLLSATEVGGDLLDYIRLPDGQFWLAIGDVTGHGLTPGLIMMMAQSILTGLVTQAPQAGPSDLLTLLNRALHQNIRYRLHHDGFMTLQLLRYEGAGRFTFAGLHCDLLIYRAGLGRVERIVTTGVWIGLLPEVAGMMQDLSFEMGADDVLLLYTDGLIEAQNAANEQFDMARLEAVLVRHGERSADEIRAHILEEVQAWLHQQLDDISLIVLKRHAVPALEASAGPKVAAISTAAPLVSSAEAGSPEPRREP